MLEEKYTKFIIDKIKQACDNCGYASSVSPFTAQQNLHVSPELSGNSAIPCIVVSCTKCGYMRFFNTTEIDKILSA